MNKEILIEIECPHCGKKSDKGNSSFMAWHFNNCKNKLGYQKLRKPGGVKKECWSPWDSPKNYDNNLKDLYRLLPDIEIGVKMYCNNCKSKLQKDSKYCHICGNKINNKVDINSDQLSFYDLTDDSSKNKINEIISDNFDSTIKKFFEYRFSLIVSIFLSSRNSL